MAGSGESPPVIDIDHSVLPTQKPYRISLDQTPSRDIGLQSKHPIWTNDLKLIWAEAEPGTVVDWHTHLPSLYQLYLNLEGRMRWDYIDNDGNEQSIEAEPGEAVFIPRGFQNRLSIPGDEHHVHVAISQNLPVAGLETLVDGSGYNPRERADSVGLWYDTDRDEVVTMHEDAVIE